MTIINLSLKFFFHHFMIATQFIHDIFRTQQDATSKGPQCNASQINLFKSPSVSHAPTSYRSPGRPNSCLLTICALINRKLKDSQIKDK